MNDVITEKLALLPAAPGVYKMLDRNGEIIYVGKAVSLKNRVRQYFQSSKAHTVKVTAMVSHIADFETILAANESEALTLECNLIKQYRPKYNILLKDDKHFPYVRIDMRQDFPRVEIVRRVKKDGARYLGPFLSGLLLSDNMRIIRDFYPVRHCKKDVVRAAARRERPCLMHHIGKCCAPCSGNVSREAYHALLEDVCDFLSGDTKKVVADLARRMDAASEALEFERAAALRDRIRAIESLSEKQSAIAPGKSMRDVFALGRLDEQAVVFALFVRDGKIMGTERFRMGSAEEEQDGDVLSAFLKQYYSDAVAFPPEVLVYQDVPDEESVSAWLSELAGRRVYVHRPQRGEKAKLTAMAYRNCLDTLEKDATLQKREWERGEGAVAQLTGLIGLESIPARLECFDNSHTRGRETVSSMVVFTDGQPDKKAYRRFRAQHDFGGDDIAAMRETLTRRLRHARDGDAGFLPLPELLIVDGGRAQLNVALEVLSEHGLDCIPAIGLAETHETIYLPEAEEPLALPRNSAALHLLERIRDEAHRFAISYHRSLRAKAMLFSVLDGVPGMGDKRKRALFDAFLTLDALKSADADALARVPGMTRPVAEAVYRRFHPEAEETDAVKEKR